MLHLVQAVILMEKEDESTLNLHLLFDGKSNTDSLENAEKCIKYTAKLFLASFLQL